MSLDIISQIWIMVFGCSAVWLVGRLEHWKRWGYICGLLSQPAWFYTTIKHEQYGITLLSFWYLYSWSQGAYNYWIKDKTTFNKLFVKIFSFLGGCRIAFIITVALLAIILASICSAGELKTSLGTTTDLAPGCSSEEQITKLDIGYKTDFKYWSNEIYTPIFIQNSELYAGIGDRLWYDVNLSKNTCLSIGAGILYIYDGGELYGLADSWLYGSLGAEFRYKSFFVGVDHVSSPFHHADSGDTGLNTIIIGFDFKF